MDHVDYPVKLTNMRYHFDGKLAGILVHVLDYLVLVDDNWVQDILKVLILMIKVGQWETEALGL